MENELRPCFRSSQATSHLLTDKLIPSLQIPIDAFALPTDRPMQLKQDSMDSFLLNCKLQPRAKIVRLLHDVYTRRWLYVMLYLTVKQPSYTTSIYDCFSYFRSNNYIDIISHSHRGSYVVLPDITTTYFLLIPFLANQDVVNGKISFFLSLQTAGLLPFYWNSNYEKKCV